MLGLNGQKHLQVGPVDAIRSMIYAWQELSKPKFGRLFRWSWVSRGLVTKEEMQEAHPDLPDAGKEDSCEESKEMVPGIPELVPPLASIIVDFLLVNPSNDIYIYTFFCFLQMPDSHLYRRNCCGTNWMEEFYFKADYCRDNS